MVLHHRKVKSQLKATLRVDLINRTRHQERQAICTLQQLRPLVALGAEPGLNVEPVRQRELSIIALNARGRLISALPFTALRAVDLIVLRKRSGVLRLGGPCEPRERLLATLGIMISADHLQPLAQSTPIRLNLLPSFVQVVHDRTIHIATSGVQGAVSIYGWYGQNLPM